MAKQQDPNSLGAMMAAQNELNGINAARLQNSQEEQAFLQQQQAANAVMMQAAQIGASGGLGQQVGAMNPQTQAILAQYGVNAAPMPGKTTTSNKVSQSGGNIRIENKTTTNNDVKVINAGTGGASGEAGNQAKFQTWLSNAFAKQQTDYEVQRRVFARRDRDLEKQSNKMMRELEKTNKGLSEKLSPESWQKTQGNQLKTVLTVLMLTLAPLIVKPIAEGLEKIKGIFIGDSNSEPEFIKKLTKKLGGEDNQSFISYLGEIIGSGIKRITDKLDLMTEDRKNAIDSIEKPSSWGIESGLKYISDLLTAALSGSKGLVKIEQRSIKENTKEFIGGFNRKGENIRLSDGFDFHTGSNFRNMMYDTDFNAFGGLKDDMNSHFALVGTITSMANNTAGIGYSAAIKNLMSKAKKGINEKRGLILGGQESAEMFLSIFGVSFKDFCDKGLIIPRSFYFFDKSNSMLWKWVQGIRTATASSPSSITWRDDIITGLKKIFSENKVEFYNICDDPEPMTEEEYKRYVQENGQDSSKIHEIILYELTEKGIKALESNLGTTFDDGSSGSYDLMHSQLETYSGKTLTRDVDLSDLQSAEIQYSGYINTKEDINNRQDAFGKAINGVANFISIKSNNGIWNLASKIVGGDNSGRYNKNEKGKIDFVNDLMTLYTKELFSYYKNKGLSDDEAMKKASMVSQWLVGQDAMETAWGNSIIGDYNYGNIKKGSWTGRTKRDSTYNEEWRSYDRPEDYIQDKLRVLSQENYNNALMSDSLEEFTEKLQTGKLKYSASDTHLEYHNKVATMTDSIQRRLVEANWKKDDEETNTTSVRGDSQLQTGNALISINQASLNNSKSNLDEAIGGINIINEKGAHVPLRSYYKNLKDSQINLIEEDIKNEAKRSLMYDIAGNRYEDFNTSSDLGPRIFLGHFNDTDSFTSIAKARLNRNDGNGARIGYFVTLTKDLRGWRKIEMDLDFNVTVLIDGKPQNINTRRVLYDKDDSFPEEWYKYTGLNKSRLYHKNPLLQQLFVDLTPRALIALKELLETAQKNIQINDGVVKIEKDGQWRNATGNELRDLIDFGFIQSGKNDPNNPHSGYMFAPGYKNIVENTAFLENALSNYRKNPNISGYFLDSKELPKAIPAKVDWAKSQVISFLNNNPLIAGYRKGYNGNPTSGEKVESSDNSSGTNTTDSSGIIISNGGNTTINNNQTIYVLGSDPLDQTDK